VENKKESEKIDIVGKNRDSGRKHKVEKWSAKKYSEKK